MRLRALIGHFLHTVPIGAFGRTQRDAVLRPLRARQRGFDRRKIELQDVGVIGGRRAVDAPQPLCLGIGLHQRNLRRIAAGEFQVANGLLVDGKDGAGGAEFRRHVRDGGPVGQRQAFEAIAEEFHEFIDDALLAQNLRDRQHQVGRGRARGQCAVELEADDLRYQHRDRLSEHRGFRLDPADAPTEHAEAVDHRGMRVGADQRIRIGKPAGADLRRKTPRGRGARYSPDARCRCWAAPP